MEGFCEDETDCNAEVFVGKTLRSIFDFKSGDVFEVNIGPWGWIVKLANVKLWNAKSDASSTIPVIDLGVVSSSFSMVAP